MDIAIVTDYSISTRYYQELTDTLIRLVGELERDDAQYAIGVIDRTRSLKVLHKFNVSFAMKS